MEHEYEVLNHLQENEITTQRRISKRTGLSLGAVNLLLKKMARKGLIKIEKLNSRTMRYILTPQGYRKSPALPTATFANPISRSSESTRPWIS
jgi:DNA-binding MarR family transcriptional regulator